MVKNILFSILALVAIVIPAIAEEADSVKKSKPKFFWGGRVDVATYVDTYNSVDFRNGVQYQYPVAPEFNSYGEDVNFQPRVRFSVAPTRFFAGVDVPNLGKRATGRAYMEFDFMGNTELAIGIPRLRHAYFTVDWRRESLLAGQTSHLVMIDEIAPPTITFGGGFPFNALYRPVQLRFTERFNDYLKLDVALAMFGSPASAKESYSLIPDLHVRLTAGKATGDGVMGGVVGGVKFVQPRMLTADSTKARQSVVTFDVAAFVSYRFGRGHTLSAYALLGQDLSQFGALGGYAPDMADTRAGVLDYGYQPVQALTAWVDYQSKSWKGFSTGIFFGYQKNLGTPQPINLATTTIVYKNLDMAYRIAPRVWYKYKMISVGVEYMYTAASWGESMTEYYRPAERYSTTFDNRVTLLGRFTF